MNASNPTLQCLGVYRVPCDEIYWRKDIDDYYAALDLLEQTSGYRGRLVPMALFEVFVSGANDKFNVGDFRQTMEGAPAEAAQVAYDEALLSSSGESVLHRKPGCADGIEAGRICFFLHHYDPARPVQWSYGEFRCPPPQPLDDRLARLVPYQPIWGLVSSMGFARRWYAQPKTQVTGSRKCGGYSLE